MNYEGRLHDGEESLCFLAVACIIVKEILYNAF